MSHLTNSQVELQLQELPGWQHQNNAITKTFVFDDFIGAFSFMTQVAFYAEQLEHHPVWSNNYNEVIIHLTTNDVNGITSLDVRLAKRIEEILAPKV